MISGDDLLSVSDEELDGNKLLNEKNDKKGSSSKLVIASAPNGADNENGENGAEQQSPSASYNGHHSGDADNVQDAIFKDGSIEIFIRAFEKRSEGINAYIVYKLETKVENIPGYSKDRYEVWRRFSDFLGLREKLVEKYQQKGIVVPNAPEKSISALTKTKLTNQTDEANTNEVAEKRSRFLQRFLRRLGRHPRLVTDCDFRDFLTMETALPKASFTSASSSVQVLLFQSVDCVIPFLLSLKQNCVLLDAKLTFAPLDLFQHLTTYTQTHTIPVEIQLLE
jgi:hypothetical protein